MLLRQIVNNNEGIVSFFFVQFSLIKKKNNYFDTFTAYKWTLIISFVHLAEEKSGRSLEHCSTPQKSYGKLKLVKTLLSINYLKLRYLIK